MGHLMPSALWAIQRQSQLRSCGGSILLWHIWHISLLSAFYRIGHWSSRSEQAWFVCLSIRKMSVRDARRPQRLLVWLASWFLLIPHTFLWWWVERPPLQPCGKFIQSEGGWGKLHHSVLCKPQLLWGARAAVAPLMSGRSSAGFIKL